MDQRNGYQKIKIGDNARAEWNDINLSGEIVQIDQALNQSKQAFGIQVEFDNPQKQVMSGVNAEIHLISESADKGIWIEWKNLVNITGGKAVYIAREGNAHLIPVQIGQQMDVNVEIISGLDEGDLLITQSQPLLEDGAKIKLIQ